MKIHEALAAVMQDVTSIGKEDFNSFHKFNFRGIDTVLNAVGPALRKHGVVPVPELQSLESRDVTTSKDKSTREVTVSVTYKFYGPEGDVIPCTVPGEAQDAGDKAVSKAMSVAFRTALIQTLSIPTQAADPDSQSYERGRPNLLAGWKQRLTDEAKKREWDMPQLAYEYGEWTEGGDIREATADELQKFYEHLVPPTRVQRAPLAAAPEVG